MARKPSAVNKNRSQSEESNISSLIQGIYSGEYILIVGSEVILDKAKFPDCNGDINQYIINEINKDNRQKINDFVDYKSFTDIIRNSPISTLDPINQLLVDEFDYRIDDMSDSLVELITTKLFRFVMTTTVDSYVETLMRAVWGEDLLVVNIEDQTSLKNLQDELSNNQGSFGKNSFSRPTLFYIFGKARKTFGRKKNFVETDIDAIKCIEKWMKLGEGRDRITPFLKERHFLSIGCKFDDWYFRFFWYIITRGFGDEGRNANPDRLDNIAMSFRDNDSDKQLKDYLSSVNSCIHCDANDFISQLNNVLTSIDVGSPFRDIILNHRREGGIFISYKSCDFTAASSLFCRLEKEFGYNVWFDSEQLHGGEDYLSEIQKVIRKTKVFIPILSSSISEDLKNQGVGLDSFYSLEWRFAAEMPGVTIIPVSIEKYNLRGEENQIFLDLINQHRRMNLMSEIHPSGVELSPRNYVNNNDDELFGYFRLIRDINYVLGIQS